MTIAQDAPTTSAETVETLSMAAAINRAQADSMEEDRSVVVFGEDVGALGGVFRVTDGLRARFGEERCFDTPLAEAGIMGTAIGMAMNGLRPVVEMQFDAFACPAFEQVVSHVAKMGNRTRGAVRMPIVIRIPYGGGIGCVEHHCDSSEAFYYAHTPGLTVVVAVNSPGCLLPAPRCAAALRPGRVSSSRRSSTGPRVRSTRASQRRSARLPSCGRAPM